MSRQQYYVPPPTHRMPAPVQGPRRVCEYATSRGTGTGDLCAEAPAYWSGDAIPFQTHGSMMDVSRPADRVYFPAPTHLSLGYPQRNFRTQPYGDRVSINPPLTDYKPLHTNRGTLSSYPSPVGRKYDDEPYREQASAPVFMPPSSNIATHSGQKCSSKCVRFHT
nr:unnamed protein product [Callosobruchus analis]